MRRKKMLKPELKIKPREVERREKDTVAFMTCTYTYA